MVGALHALLVVCLGWCFDYLFGLDGCYAEFSVEFMFGLCWI